jgi:photosystem II stability/assembly factor-like uncharacterized protein
VVAETDADLYQIQMFEDGTAYACGADGIVVKTVNKGETWNWAQIKEGVELRVMHWIDPQRGFFAGKFRTEYRYYRTTDGGRSFARIDLELPFIPRDFEFLDHRRGFVVCGSSREKDGGWRITTDGGTTWKQPEDPRFFIPGRVLYGIDSVGGKHVWAVGGPVEANMVGAAAKSLLYQQKEGSVLHSADAGRTWEVQEAGNPPGTYLRDVEFTDEQHGWVVGDDGFVATTRDGGRTWTKGKSGTKERLLAVSPVSLEVAFAVGYHGTVIATRDRGENWNSLDPKTDVHIRDCSFVDDRTGYICGKNGRVMRFARAY